MARRALGYRSLEVPGNRHRRQMVTVPQGIQNPAYVRSRSTTSSALPDVLCLLCINVPAAAAAAC